MARTKKELGYVLKVSEIERIKNALQRLKGIIDNAVEENDNLRGAYDRLNANAKDSDERIKMELYKLIQSGQWMDILLGGCREDVKFIYSHLNCLLTLIQINAANKLDLTTEDKDIKKGKK